MPLPTDWNDIVSRFRAALDDLETRLAEREQEFAAKFPANEQRPVLANVPVRQLSAALEPHRAAIQSADDDAESAHIELKALAERSESLRLRLADWLGTRSSTP